MCNEIVFAFGLAHFDNFFDAKISLKMASLAALLSRSTEVFDHGPKAVSASDRVLISLSKLGLAGV